MEVWLVLLMQIGIVFILDYVPLHNIREQHLLTLTKWLLAANCVVTVVRLLNYGGARLLQNTNLGINLLILLLVGYWGYRRMVPETAEGNVQKKKRQ
ncbi:hypothetical protein [Loigolactobacillus coryniformis]|uniref:Uncharacterized protein n=1 Tax=Loigolactobacillus coryniformis subsp. torquens DSM 20004 = KCTC 3535 TaxID=1423822 RepID=A0A2D1KK85_9LACO|nr:hypothetical protein [Loigolactobacillus coryniformis]ATO42547.1 hypothetical protein LC20004_00825 [Loigolactobacillus coryniformis subsp. torquens DSM 20004 = KCTC 3535]KRK80332.1 hypothetical protein FC16_GL002265 [Loigolactobacillus coryniformis subsp. torquens DSM 20004 = KCTC 3535]